LDAGDQASELFGEALVDGNDESGRTIAVNDGDASSRAWRESIANG